MSKIKTLSFENCEVWQKSSERSPVPIYPVFHLSDPSQLLISGEILCVSSWLGEGKVGGAGRWLINRTEPSWVRAGRTSGGDHFNCQACGKDNQQGAALLTFVEKLPVIEGRAAPIFLAKENSVSTRRKVWVLTCQHLLSVCFAKYWFIVSFSPDKQLVDTPGSPILQTW
jgi:hypothetical protein